MNAPTTTSRLHPLVAVAAVAVTVLSLTGIAAMTGYLPTGKAATPTETAAAVPPAPTLSPPQTTNEVKPVEKAAVQPAPKPAPKPVAKAPQPAREIAQAPAMPAPPAPVAAPAPCPTCGVIDNVREVTQAGEGSGLGAVAGGVIGGILGHQVGGGTGKKIATVAGVAGGAYAGHQVEKSQKKTTRYEITVRMRDGSLRTVTQDSVPAWRIGERVRVENGTLMSDNY
ncbi:MAG: glycine zipper 2TM domain-containing protein [Gammaproteobacteria bacterium]|nr:glycine zipper 2TM domain-containing protein [Rhodocyclaceae bacterium]MBU3909124.1 glycine zipper 2TM domain-containing protein [Gammaproteobacteria bacterium]MBU3988130.1 glycine zipper 2TM domain-containing protein [Gammaproteobacteria bacterium]MBU4003335.1 glycine zipper 2TM domain-containing protein [Gammaproteobacteria bacterium]MBU4022167.1 glycine zipper 2TM domain-containing protein [Gammaproteobacteria bacterium]